MVVVVSEFACTNKYLMTGLKVNSEFCFLETLNVVIVVVVAIVVAIVIASS